MNTVGPIERLIEGKFDDARDTPKRDLRTAKLPLTTLMSNITVRSMLKNRAETGDPKL